MMRALGWAFDLMVSAVFGALLATLIAVGCLQSLVGHAFLGSDIWFCDQNIPWLIARHRAVGVWWLNASQSTAPLLGEVPYTPPGSQPSPAEGTPPEPWAERALPPLRGLPQGARVGVIAFGWPVPMVTRAWVALFQQDGFPMAAEVDVGGAVLENAVRRVGESEWRDLRVMPSGVFLDALPWSLLGLWSMRRLRARDRSRAVSPPAAAAAPPAPAP